ncbi:MAG: cytochrome B6 [Betaproteobacteria bacterium]|nr:cytochrome B6 [Betaproteobacteria bacterium]
MPGYRTPLAATALTVAATFSPANLAAPGAEFATTREGIVGTYRRAVPDDDFETSKARDEKTKPRVMERQQQLLNERYDLSDRPSKLMMSGGRRAVQDGVRVRLPSGMSWEKLSQMTPDQVKAQRAFPKGFLPLPHVKHETGGMVFPQFEIDEIDKQERRTLKRFDIDFDLPDHMLPEFPPPIFLQQRPELGDVSQGQVVTTRNFFKIFNGILTPVQMEGLRLLLHPFPQEEFNMTGDRKVAEPQFGIACLDCHVNFHTNAAFHLNPDTRPQERRFRIDTVSLRGLFNQQIHGSKRSLRSVEDFTEFEQTTAYFNGDHVSASKKGSHQPNRTTQVSLMAQVQNMIDFPPAPKLDPTGRLDPSKATKQELAGEKVFVGKGRCAECHKPPHFLDHQMHDLKLERFYTPEVINGQKNGADGPIKTFTLRGIKDSPPYLHDGRLLTLEDTVEFFNMVLQLKLTTEEKQSLVAYMRQL